ncbi:MAG: AAA family ATPase, partial [Candidatus Margulisbacteria bacterium]|nr:AAA family ATPase [Candidatus Margulisiibacteriota bacterium]
MPIISIINQKGGVGKSTLALQLSAALNKLKEKTLLIDMDPQGHLSLGLGIEKNNLKKSIFNVLDVRYENGMGLADVTIKVNDYLDLIPSNIELSTLELILANRHGRESRLSNALNPQLTSQYDYIIIDCPPNLGMLTINALLASEYVIVPFDTSAFSIDGINYLNSTLQMLSNKINHKVDICYVLNNYDARVQKNKNYY